MRRSVLEYLEEAAHDYPDKVAFIDQQRTLTFRETKKESLCIAREIQSVCPDRRSPILVYLPKGISCITAFLGILYSGNFYTPTDVKFPFKKVKSIIDVLHPSLIITDEEHIQNLLENHVPIEQILNISHLSNEEENIDSNAYLENIISLDPVYILFTSGSTGTPKGVVINNLSILDYIDWACEKFNINTETIMGNQSPFYFDLCTQDIYATLKGAATLVILPEIDFIFPVKSIQHINEYHINYLYWVPSAFVNVSRLRILDKISVPSLKTMIFGGEVMPVKHLNYWREKVPSLTCIANMCGPTETTVNYSCYIVNRDFSENEVLPLGQAIPNREILLLDEEGHPVKSCNSLGEICIRGIALSAGYYNNHEKTNLNFVQNPLNTHYLDLIYKTGDLAYYNEQQELVYAGRKDFQIKHMGYRIELGEIEAAAVSCDNVSESCCLYDKEEKQILLCYVGEIDSASLSANLVNILPKYMLPQRYEKLSCMPHNDNGKTDRNLLFEKFISKK